MLYVRYFLLLLLVMSHPISLFSKDQPSEETSKTVLITGGAGFIGSNFVKYMYDKYPTYHFIVLDALTYAGSLDKIPSYIRASSRFEFVHNSILNVEAVDAAMSKSDWVVHFAAETHVTRSIFEDEVFFITDILGTRVLMNAVRKYSKKVERFVHISTSEVYGTAEYEPMDESHPLNPRSPYAAAKAGADRLVYSYCCTYDVPAVIIRPFNNYGPGQHLEKCIPRLIVSAIKKQPLTIHGTGAQTRDWVFTIDTSRAIDSVLHHKNFKQLQHQVINVGTGKDVSVLDIALMILEHFKLPDTQLKFVGDRPGQVDCHISSTSKAKELLNWSANTSFEEGLKQTIDWYVQNPEVWKNMEKDVTNAITTTNGTVENH